MKKEIIVAILFGVAFGGVAAFILLMKNNEFQLTKSKTITPSGKVTNTVKNIVKTPSVLEVSEPVNNTVVATKQIQIKGKAEKGSLLIFQSPSGEVIVNTAKEEFSVNFPLVLGENVILISMHPNSTQSRLQEKEIRIYYIDESL